MNYGFSSCQRGSAWDQCWTIRTQASCLPYDHCLLQSVYFLCICSHCIVHVCPSQLSHVYSCQGLIMVPLCLFALVLSILACTDFRLRIQSQMLFPKASLQHMKCKHACLYTCHTDLHTRRTCSCRYTLPVCTCVPSHHTTHTAHTPHMP